MKLNYKILYTIKICIRFTLGLCCDLILINLTNILQDYSLALQQFSNCLSTTEAMLKCLLHDLPWICPWIKSLFIWSDIVSHKLASQMLHHVMNSWHQQVIVTSAAECKLSETQSRCVGITFHSHAWVHYVMQEVKQYMSCHDHLTVRYSNPFIILYITTRKKQHNQVCLSISYEMVLINSMDKKDKEK